MRWFQVVAALLPAAITAEDTGLADINDFHDVATLISDGSQNARTAGRVVFVDA